MNRKKLEIMYEIEVTFFLDRENECSYADPYGHCLDPSDCQQCTPRELLYFPIPADFKICDIYENGNFKEKEEILKKINYKGNSFIHNVRLVRRIPSFKEKLVLEMMN